MCPSQKKETTPSNGDSAIPAEAQWYLEGFGEGEVTTVKCSKCTIPTLHFWTKLQPKPIHETNDAIEVLSKAKRLTLCTACGTLKLIT